MRWEDRVETTQRVAPDWETGTEAGIRAWHEAGAPTVAVTGPVTYIPEVDRLAEAQGVEFDCPKCANGHRIAVAFAGRGVLDHQASRAKDGRPTRWAVSGTGFADLSLSPSVDCTRSDPNCWHGFITNGEVT